MTTPTRPVLRYHGGKFRIAPWIIDHFPAHRIYAEPFGGGGSVLMRKPRSDFEIYNDLDSDVVNVFRVLRDRAGAAELERVLRLTPWSHREFDDSYVPCPESVERARRTIVRCFMGHGTTSRRRNRTGFRAGSHPNRAGGGFGDWRGYHDAVPTFCARLMGVVIEERDAFDILNRYDAPDTLFYVDPPYPSSTRTSVRGPGDGDRCYSHDMLDDDSHRYLASVLHGLAAAVVVSGYPCPLFDDELYAGWKRDDRHANADRGASRTERLWIKPPGAMEIPRSFVQSSLQLSLPTAAA